MKGIIKIYEYDWMKFIIIFEEVIIRNKKMVYSWWIGIMEMFMTYVLVEHHLFYKLGFTKFRFTLNFGLKRNEILNEDKSFNFQQSNTWNEYHLVNKDFTIDIKAIQFIISLSIDFWILSRLYLLNISIKGSFLLDWFDWRNFNHNNDWQLSTQIDFYLLSMVFNSTLYGSFHFVSIIETESTSKVHVYLETCETSMNFISMS